MFLVLMMVFNLKKRTSQNGAEDEPEQVDVGTPKKTLQNGTEDEPKDCCSCQYHDVIAKDK